MKLTLWKHELEELLEQAKTSKHRRVEFELLVLTTLDKAYMKT